MMPRTVAFHHRLRISDAYELVAQKEGFPFDLESSPARTEAAFASMSTKGDTVSSGPDSPYVEEPDEGQLQQAPDAGLIEHDAAAPPRATDLLQDTSRMVQGMMTSMGDPGVLASSGEPAVQSSSTTMMQSAIVNPDGTVSTGIAGDPSGNARTASSYNATTNTITTATVDPASGSITTTSTTVPRAAAGKRAVEGREQA